MSHFLRIIVELFATNFNLKNLNAQMKLSRFLQ